MKRFGFMTSLFASLMLPFSRPASASAPAAVGNVSGTGIEMKVYDHAVAGAIHDSVAWGFLDESSGVSQLIMRKYGQTFKTEFKKRVDGSFGGVITSGEGPSARSTPVSLIKVDAPSRMFMLRLGAEEITVTIASEGMANGHYINPTYSTVIGGKPVSYRMQTEGCMSFSIQMAMMILGAYVH